MHVETKALTVEEVRQQTDKLLDQHFQTRRGQAETISPSYERLWQAISTASGGGKRLRPYLVYLGYSICGGDDKETVLRIGVSVELLHLCMLAHDDIIDRDFVRHGRPNVAGSYRPVYLEHLHDQAEADHFANAAALLAGDLLLSDAYQYAVNTAVPETVRPRLNRLLDHAIFTVAGGELIDSEAPMLPIEASDSLQIAEYKTSYYSCAVPLALGAVLAGADESVEKLFMEVGKNLGIAYQLTDDLLGTFGDEAVTGKSNNSDLYEAKRTYLLQQTYRLVDEAGRQTIDTILRDHRHDDAQLQTIKQLMISSGAKAATEELRQQFIDKALSVSTELQQTIPAASRLDDFIRIITERNS